MIFKDNDQVIEYSSHLLESLTVQPSLVLFMVAVDLD